MPLTHSAANATPPEILLQIFSLLDPRDFDNARRTCSQWMRTSLNRRLLERMLKRAGWWDAWQQDCQMEHSTAENMEQSVVWKMSRRFATECVLSGRETNIENRLFLTTSVVDFSQLSRSQPAMKARKSSSCYPIPEAFRKPEPVCMSKFSVSGCGSYLLVTSGCTIFVYRLLNRKYPCSVQDASGMDIAPVTSISCCAEVLTATIDTTTPNLVVGALLRGRIGMICDLDMDTVRTLNGSGSSGGMPPSNPSSRRYYHDLCSADDPPRNISICPGRRCLAFGCSSAIELRWVCWKTGHDCRKHFPMAQASEVLHFLPNRPDKPTEVRLISSPAGPGASGCQCRKALDGSWQRCQTHVSSDAQKSIAQHIPKRDWRPSIVRATHCYHYRAVPINDGMHILFIEPHSGLLCIGPDATIGGPTSLTRALLCVPPFMSDASDRTKSRLAPTVFSAGSDTSWGLRVVAAYGDRIVLYSVPVDLYNLIRKDQERQGDDVMGDGDLLRDWFLDSERSSKQCENSLPNHNEDQEARVNMSYRPTATMWPFKIYGKEIGTMDESVVELALQCSHGSVRVWAFGGSGASKVFDVDTFTSVEGRPADVPCKSVSIRADGSLLSMGQVNRTDLRSDLKSSRKRKNLELRIDFGGPYPTTQLLHGMSWPGWSQATISAAEKRQASFAACIVDFKMPELGAREGRWIEGRYAP